MFFREYVKGNKENCTKNEIKAIDDIRNLQVRYGWPLSTNLKKYITEGHIMNYSYLETLVYHSDEIYGSRVPIIKGKVLIYRPHHVKNI